jgi:hypothetical protein
MEPMWEMKGGPQQNTPSENTEHGVGEGVPRGQRHGEMGLGYRAGIPDSFELFSSTEKGSPDSEFELRVYTLSHSTSPLFVMDFFSEIRSLQLFAWDGFKLCSS